MFISTSTVGPHEGNLRAEKTRILVHKFCVRLVETFGGAATRMHQKEMCTSWYFFQKSWTKSFTWNVPLLFAKHANLLLYREVETFNSLLFSGYDYTIIFMHDISDPSNGCLVHDANMHKIFSALNVAIILTKPFMYNNTICTLFQWNITFSLNLFY